MRTASSRKRERTEIIPAIRHRMPENPVPARSSRVPERLRGMEIRLRKTADRMRRMKETRRPAAKTVLRPGRERSPRIPMCRKTDQLSSRVTERKIRMPAARRRIPELPRRAMRQPERQEDLPGRSSSRQPMCRHCWMLCRSRRLLWMM